MKVLILVIITVIIFSCTQKSNSYLNDNQKAQIKELTEKIKITELINNYSRYADRRQPQKQSDLFTDDATIEIYRSEPENHKPDTILHGKKEFKAGFETLKKYDVTMHFNGQNTIHIYGDSATGEVYCLAHHLWIENSKRMLMVMGIRYYDTYVLKNNEWLFAKRKLIFDWVDKRLSTSE
jgi:hypothetical protein